MNEIDRLLDLLHRTFEGDAWHGPSVRKCLDGVDAEKAARRPVAAAHSIWEITKHMTVWKEEVTRRLGGRGARDLSPEEDWPPVRESDQLAWQAAVDGLTEAHQQLERVIARLPLNDLDKDLSGNGGAIMWTVYTTIHGIIQHDLYHAGQIALLRKG